MTDALHIDPHVFRPEAIDPETAAFNGQLEAQLAALPGWYHPESAPALRALAGTTLQSPHPRWRRSGPCRDQPGRSPYASSCRTRYVASISISTAGAGAC